MVEKLKLKDFDIIGLIKLKDIQGIEKYVTPLENDDGKIDRYLSRSKEYYNVKTMSELAVCREELRDLLTRECSKKNFVILENMLNCSGKVYFKKFEEYIKAKIYNKEVQKYEIQIEEARQCLVEDMKNILSILEGKNLIKVDPTKRLPGGHENSEQRAIEMDNKALLYIFAKALGSVQKPEQIEIVTPGYGGVYIGPMLNAMYDYNFTTILKSKYIEDTCNLEDVDVKKLVSNQRLFEEGKKVLLLDDNVGTGLTLKETKQMLQNSGIKDIAVGAIQYNWRNYYRVSVGEKKDIERFEINDVDILTPINYAGHKLYKNAIHLLHSSGKEYISYLKSKAYQKEFSDIQGAVRRGILCARPIGLELDTENKTPNRANLAENAIILDKYKNSPTEIKKSMSKNIVSSIIKSVEEIEKEQEEIRIK